MKFKSPYIGFDLETYSPNGFPYDRQDPIVSTTLAMSMGFDLREGLFLASLICPPSREKTLLMWLQRFLISNGKGCLVTYNGTRFDLDYVIRRGRLHGIDLGSVFCGYKHFDLYRVIKNSGVVFPSYGQKKIEKCLGIPRVVDDVCGASYYESFQNFLKFGDLKALFYNIEDSVGCLRIFNMLTANDESMERSLFSASFLKEKQILKGFMERLFIERT